MLDGERQRGPRPGGLAPRQGTAGEVVGQVAQAGGEAVVELEGRVGGE
ncbi:hypothetical protein ACFQX8_06585 [Klenkia terrae]